MDRCGGLLVAGRVAGAVVVGMTILFVGIGLLYIVGGAAGGALCWVSGSSSGGMMCTLG